MQQPQFAHKLKMRQLMKSGNVVLVSAYKRLVLTYFAIFLLMQSVAFPKTIRYSWQVVYLVYCLPFRSTCVHPRFIVLCVCFIDRCLSVCHFYLLTIVLSVLLLFTDYNYSFGIFKLFLHVRSDYFYLMKISKFSFHVGVS